MRETEEEVSRWREACELEVKAGKDAVDKRDKMVCSEIKSVTVMYYT